MKEEQDALGVVMLNSMGLPTDSCWGKACRGVFSDFITNKFEGEISEQEQPTQGGCEFETEVPGAPENSQPNRPQTKKR